MKFLKRIFEYLIYTNLFIATAAAILVYVTFEEFSFSNPLVYGFFIFGSTLFIYNVQRLIKFRKRQHSSYDERTRNLYKILSKYFSIIGGVLSIYFVFKIPPTVTFIISGTAFLSLAYVLPFSIAKKFSGLRELPFLKIYLIAFIWTITTAYIPISQYSECGLKSTILFCAERFLFILAITIPFDIRDLLYDPPTFKTIPQLLGIKKSKILAVILLLICALIVAFQAIDLNVSASYFLAAILTYFVSVFLIMKTDSDKNNLYFSGVIDGTMLFFGFVYLILNDVI